MMTRTASHRVRAVFNAEFADEKASVKSYLKPIEEGSAFFWGEFLIRPVALTIDLT
jgi:hypothetical protein